MDRDIPVFNRPVMQKIFRKNQQKHLQRLRNIKTGASNRTMPITNPPNHSLSNKKAILAEQLKKTEIEKQNVLLFNKMMRIMKRNDPYNQSFGSVGQGGRGGKMQSENSRIVEENRGILERIQQQRPTISNKKLQEDRMKNLNILKFLGKFPNPGAQRMTCDTTSSQMGRKSETTKKKYQSYYNRGGENLQEFELDQEAYDEELKHYQEQIDKLKDRSLHTSSGRRKYMSQAVNRTHNKMDSQQNQGLSKLQSVDITNQVPQLYQQYRVKQRQQSKPTQKSHTEAQPQKLPNPHPHSHPHPTKQITLFHKNTQISRTQASVSIIRLYNIYKIRAVFEQPVKGNRVYELEIPENQGNQFFSQNNYDYGKICKMLIIEDGCLVVNTSACLGDDGDERDGKEGKEGKGREKEKVLIEKLSQVRIGEAGQQQQWAKYEQALEQYIQ